MKASFVGEIAVIESRGESRVELLKFAKQLLLQHKNVRTVALKASKTEGRYRVRKVRVIAGVKSTETAYRENGCTFKLDLNKAYFSPRLSHERQRIASLVKPGERVLVLFAGVGPYAIVIARALGKKIGGTKIVGVELNPAAVKYFEQNIAANKVHGSVSAVKADAKKFLAKKENARAFDRVIMPLPKTADKFLEGAVRACKKKGTVHFYSIASELQQNPYLQAERRIKEVCAGQKRKCKVTNERVALPYAPRVVQIVVDFKVD